MFLGSPLLLAVELWCRLFDHRVGRLFIECVEHGLVDSDCHQD